MDSGNLTWAVAPSEHALVVSPRPSSAEPASSPVGPPGREDGKVNALVGPSGGPGPLVPPLRPPDFAEPRPRPEGPAGPDGPPGPPDSAGPPNPSVTTPSPSTLSAEPAITTVTVTDTLPATTAEGAPTTPLFPPGSETTGSASAAPGTFTTIISAPFPTFVVPGTATATSLPPTTTAIFSTAEQSRLPTTTTASPAASVTMEPGSRASQDDGATNDHRTLVITLSSVLSVVGLVVMAIGVYLMCLRNRRARRRLPLFNRGITPIPDDEIASWKINKARSEKSPARYTTRNPPTYGHKKASSQTPSLIQYHNPGKTSLDYAPHSPRSFLGRHSNDLPQSPQSAVLAKAPNARTGLTDQAVPGDDPFLPAPRRQPSRLHKLPGSPAVPQRSRGGSRSNSMRSFAEVWYGENMSPLSPRASSEVMPASTRAGSSRVYSTSTAPPRLSLTDDMMGGLSPPPLHRTEIGRALG